MSELIDVMVILEFLSQQKTLHGRVLEAMERPRERAKREIQAGQNIKPKGTKAP